MTGSPARILPLAVVPGRPVLLASFRRNGCEVWATMDRTLTMVERVDWTGHLRVRVKAGASTLSGQQPDGTADFLVLDPPVLLDDLGFEVAWV